MHTMLFIVDCGAVGGFSLSFKCVIIKYTSFAY